MSESRDSTTWDTIFSELLMISYLCGYPGGTVGGQRTGPRIGDLKEIMDKCISLGPYGYGLALYALIIALSGGTIPYWSVMPVPFGSIGKITRMCTVHGALLRKEGITEDEGYFTVTAMETAVEDDEHVFVASYQDAFAVVVSYLDSKGRENTRVFIIQHTGDPNYPWMSIIPSDENAEKIAALCREGHTMPSHEDLLAIAYPVAKIKPEAGGETAAQVDVDLEAEEFGGEEEFIEEE